MRSSSDKATTTDPPVTPEQREAALREAGWVYVTFRPYWFSPDGLKIEDEESAYRVMRAERGEK